MAWLCSARSNRALVEKLAAAEIAASPRVRDAMLAVDRALFVPRGAGPRDHAAVAYADCPQPIGYGATISAPHMHAYALEMLEPFLTLPGARALDVGAGSGYLVACMERMIDGDRTGKVVGIEHISELTDMARTNLERWDATAVSDGRVVCVTGDGRLGYPEYAPYAAIHVGAAAPEIPDALIDQLAAPGRMLIPVGPEYGAQQLVQVDKDAQGNVTRRRVMGVRYVPLTDKAHQLGEE